MFKSGCFLPFLLILLCCNNNSEQKTTSSGSSDSSNNETRHMKNWGNLEGKTVSEYVIKNQKGMSVAVLNYGCIVTHLITPDRKGNAGDVVLGYTGLEGYLQKDNPYFGALIGRYANRIGGAAFTLEGKKYSLAPNNNGNTLHGGIRGYDKVVWNVDNHTDSSIQFSYLSKDGEEGFPGNVKATVIYSVTPQNEFRIEYKAETDQATPINLTNHSYFNLSAGLQPNILDHEVTIYADKFTPVNDQLIPTGNLSPVSGTIMDFTKPKKIGQDLDKVKGGYDHNYVLNKSGNTLSPAASVYDSLSGRFMEVLTTQPGIQLYTGNFLDGKLKYTKSPESYGPHAALCLETQHFPDSPNKPQFPTCILLPGSTYDQITIYKFSVR